LRGGPRPSPAWLTGSGQPHPDWRCRLAASGRIGNVPELPEVEALAADLRERAVGREIDRADVAEFSVLKTYDPPLSALHGARISGTSRRGKFLDLSCTPAAGGADLHLVTHLARAGWLRCRQSRRSRARARWRSGCDLPTARAST
jgi:formamidopyrimidine-DNA glycosylase